MALQRKLSGRCVQRVPPRTARVVCSASTSKSATTPVSSTSTNGAPTTFFDPVKNQAVPVPDDVAPLFKPIKVGSWDLAHRVVLAPLTRCRAIDERAPTPAMVEYYSQRATRGGLLLSEATIVDPYGAGFPDTPGIYTDKQEAGWRKVTDAVHAKGGLILCQLWHCGRQSHSDFFPTKGVQPIAPSAIAVGPKFTVFSPKAGKMVPYETPRAMEIHEIKKMAKTWAEAAKRALAAGFDGVEVHGANGYLLDTFLRDGSNKRTDEYGVSIENRARFHLEITQAVVDAVSDPGRVGIRLSPFQEYGDMHDSTPYATFVYLVEQLKRLNIAYVHMTESRSVVTSDEQSPQTESLEPFRIAFGGRFIACGDYKRAGAVQAIVRHHADLVAFGRPFLSSPDLPARLVANVEPNTWDRDTFYVPDQTKGYTDYPFMKQ